MTMKVIGNWTPEAICSALRQYWRDRGYEIKTEIVTRTAVMQTFEDGKQSKITCREVASNLVNGLPPQGSAIVKEAAE
jgi:hypothetical protein